MSKDFGKRKSTFRNFQELYEKVAADGKEIPRAAEIEASVLGALLSDKPSVSRAIEVLGRTDDDEPSPFFYNANAAIYRAVLDLDDAHEPVDLLTVTAKLRAKGLIEDCGGAGYLAMLTGKVVSTANVENHARMLMEYMIRRELIRNGEEQKLRAWDMSEDVFDAIEQSDVSLYRLNQVRYKKSWKSLDQLSDEVTDSIQRIMERNLDVTGVPSDLEDLDRMTNGWQEADLIIIGARPSQGKSALSNVLARNASLGHKIPVGIFSLEMKAHMLLKRMVCSHSGLDLLQVNKGKLTPEEWKRYAEANKIIRKAPIYIDDTPGITPGELKAKARRLKQKEGIGLLIIDYLQLMEAGEKVDSREQGISKISRSLKMLAMDLDMPVIALSQLSRELEKRKNNRPMLSDLRESGAIEQDADVVIFIHRPETYGIEKFEDTKPTDGIAELIIGKQRNGPIGTVRVKFEKTSGDFSDIAPFFPDEGRLGSW